MGNAEKERSSDVFLPDSEKKIPKKQQNNSKGKKKNIMASFQAKIGCKRMRKEEKKNHSDGFPPDLQ